MTHNIPNGEGKLAINGVEIRYSVRGRGPVLLMQAPGWGIGAAPYEATMAPLEKEFTLIHYDPRASGASTAPLDANDLGVHANVADLEALRRHLGIDRFAIMGHSHGGLIALHYAMQHPDRVTHVIPLAAQLIGVPARADAHARVEAELQKDPIFAQTFRWFMSVGGFGQVATFQTDAEFASFLRRAAPIYFRRGKNAAALAAVVPDELPLRTVIEVSAKDARFPIDERVAAIGAKMLIVSGAYDYVCPHSSAEALHARVPGSQLATFHDSAHFPWIEEPALFFETITRFLKTPSARAPAAAPA